MPCAMRLVSYSLALLQSIGLGRAWKHRALGLNEMHLTSSTVRRLGLKPNAGERLMLNIDLSSLLGVTRPALGLSVAQCRR